MRPPALSLWRPYPTLIFGAAGKDIENRTWSTYYRGDVLVHAAKGWDPGAFTHAQRIGATIDDVHDLELHEHPLGIIGVVEVYDICKAAVLEAAPPCECSGWATASKQYHWKLRNPQAFPQPVPHSGAQRMWRVSDRMWPDVFTQLKEVGRVG